MLEKVGEAATAPRLEAKTNLVVNADRNERRGMVGRGDNAQTVCESRVLDRDVELFQRGLRFIISKIPF
jgi:hypothetical protein